MKRLFISIIFMQIVVQSWSTGSANRAIDKTADTVPSASDVMWIDSAAEGVRSATLEAVVKLFAPAVGSGMTENFIAKKSGSDLANSPAYVNALNQVAAPVLSASNITIGSASTTEFPINIIGTNEYQFRAGTTNLNAFLFGRDNVTSGAFRIAAVNSGVTTVIWTVTKDSGYTGVGFPPGTPGSMFSVFGGAAIGSASAAQAAPSNGLLVQGGIQSSGDIATYGADIVVGYNRYLGFRRANGLSAGMMIYDTNGDLTIGTLSNIVTGVTFALGGGLTSLNYMRSNYVNGYIGIATNNPPARLSINGDTYCSGSYLGPSSDKDMLGPLDDVKLKTELVSKVPQHYNKHINPEYAKEKSVDEIKTAIVAGLKPEERIQVNVDAIAVETKKVFDKARAAAEVNANRERYGLHISELPEAVRSQDSEGVERFDISHAAQYNLATNIEQQKQIEALIAENAEIKAALATVLKRLEAAGIK